MAMREIYELALQLQEENHKLKTIIRHATAERTGVFFICGDGGDLDEMGLPLKLFVCPSYGLDGFAIYTRTTDYTAPEY